MRIKHIAMYVNKLEKVGDFYVKYFGMSDSKKDCARIGYIHIVFYTGAKEKVDKLTEETVMRCFSYYQQWIL